MNFENYLTSVLLYLQHFTDLKTYTWFHSAQQSFGLLMTHRVLARRIPWKPNAERDNLTKNFKPAVFFLNLDPGNKANAFSMVYVKWLYIYNTMP